MTIKKNFELFFRDRFECEHLLMQIRFNDIVICEINKEKGNDHMEVQMLCNDPIYNQLDIRFPLDDFFEVLKVAKEELLKV